MNESEEEKEARLARNFIIALRTEGVADKAARFITKRAIELHRRFKAAKRPEQAREALSNARAKLLAERLRSGAQIS